MKFDYNGSYFNVTFIPMKFDYNGSYFNVTFIPALFDYNGSSEEKGLELWWFTPIFQSLKSVLLVKETGVPGENHWPAASD
jgi:hypothetical protein